MTQQTRLTKADLRAIEHRTQAEAETRLGPPPTLQTLDADGLTMQRMLASVLDFIQGVGMVLTMLTAELITSLAALALMIVFAALEVDRIKAGALALGQTPGQAQLIAGALVVGNVVTPIYALRNLRGQVEVTRTRATARGVLIDFARRLFALPETYKADVNDNPTLRLAKAALLWATIGFAMLSVLGPLLAAHAGERWYTAIVGIVAASNLTDFLKVLAGLLLSFGGVFFLQSAAHEVGVRVITGRPESARAVLEAERAAYREALAAIRDEVTADHVAGKLADAERKRRREAQDLPFEATGANGRGW